MGAPFERTVAVVNDILKPMAQFIQDNATPPHDDYAQLYATAINHDVAHYLDKIGRAHV